MVGGMLAKGYQREFAERCFGQIEGFGEYGFPESHAASFAILVYASAWLKCHYPEVFAAALLNAQPMGFYAPSQIVRDVREHGVEVRPPDINFSGWDSTLEPGQSAAGHLHAMHSDMRGDVQTTHAIRLGLREIKGLREEDAILIGEKRAAGYDSVRDLWLRTGLAQRVLERLADADAFGSLGLSRRDALWAAKALGRVGDRDDDLPLFMANAGDAPLNFTAREPDVALPPMPIGEEVVNDYRFLRLSLRAHPAQFLRDDLARHGIVRNESLRTTASGRRVRVSGLVTCRQRPGSANGVVFMTIEDETSLANVIIWPKVFERCRPIILGARYVAVRGPLQSESGVIHVVAEDLEDLTPWLAKLADHGATIDGLARCDEVRRPIEEMRLARAQGCRENRLQKLIRDMPELAADLDTPARGSAHAPGRRARA
jgi:error-prone DNA polymerase